MAPLGAAKQDQDREMTDTQQPVDPERSYGVYVIELSGLENTLYVGQSSLPPTKRLKNHLRGYKASRIVRKHGGRLRWDLFKHIPRFDSWQEAIEAEAALARELRQRGYDVRGGH